MYLPNNWKKVELGEIAQLQRGKTITAKTAIAGEIPVISGGKKPAYYHNESNRSGEIITVSGSGASAGFLMYWDTPIYVADAFSIKGLDDVNNKWLYYALLTNQDEIYNRKKGSGIPHVYPKDLTDLPIPFPPLSEQTQIATLLDNHLNQLDQIKEKLTNILPIIKQFRQSVLVQAVSGGLTNNKQKIGWNMTVLGKVAKWSSGGTPPRKNPQYYEGDIAWIKTGDLGEKFITQTSEYITQEAINNSSAKLFPKGSVALAMYGATIGKTSILGIDATTNQACAVAIPNDDLNNEFLYYLLLSEKDNFILKGQGGAQPNISQTIIKEHPVCIPPLAEQTQIVQQVEHYFAKADQLENHIKSALENINHMTQSLLHQAFIGNLTKEWREKG